MCSLFFPAEGWAQIEADYSQYLAARKKLMQQDSLLYFDYGMILTEQEQLLNSKLAALQASMLQEYKAQHFFPPARNFYLSKDHAAQSTLFKWLQKMPKGGILHLHAGAMGDANWIIERAVATPEMYVYWEGKNKKYVKGQLHAFPKEAVPVGFVQAKKLDATEKAFRSTLKDLLTFENAMDRDSVDIWKEFQSIFQRINGFIKYRPIFVDYISHGLEILVADNIQHAELRMPFSNSTYRLGQEKDKSNMEDYVAALQEIEDRIKALDPDFTFNIIHTELRFKEEATIWEDIQNIYQNKRNYPRWIRGYDLVAEEDNGHATLFHAKNFLRLDSLEKEYQVQLPLYLHDGESNWVSVDNLYDAVLLGTKRIGHGFNLFRFPNLLEVVKEKDICLEINPLSNQILGYVRDLRNHPASTYLRRGIPCTISSDDPLIFDYHGLTYDYWAIYLAWELDLAALKQLSKNSIIYAAMTDEEKAKALDVWQQRWKNFVLEMNAN